MMSPDELHLVESPLVATILNVSAGVPEGGQTDRPLRTLKSLVASVVALALCACFAVLQVSKWPNRLRYPGVEDAAEGTQLAEMVHLRRGVHIYRAPSGGEFDGAVYGPLCYLAG